MRSCVHFATVLKWCLGVLYFYSIPLCSGNDGADDLAFAAPGQQSQPKFGAAQAEDRRYFFYDVNMGEGFNLRRDVYMRAACLVKELRKADSSWVMVLPPYRHLYHWQSRELDQSQIPWRKFFDLDKLGEYVPVIEFDQYLAETRGNSIEQVWYLQGYAGGWKDGTWEEKIDFAECLDDRGREYQRTGDVWYGPFFGYYDAIHAKKFRCVSTQGTSLILKDKLLQFKGRSILVDRFETVLHPVFGDKEYWLSRKSMGYAKHLKLEAETFMKKHLPRQEGVDNSAKGLPYLAVHLRRGDFARSYKGRPGVPSDMKSAAEQIKKALKRTGLKVVYVASDASEKELAELKRLLPTMEHYKPSKKRLDELLDGGVAIVEQWICANARHFIGTDPSTYTFRINEDRELLGMPASSTFNGFCADGYKDLKDEEKCAHPTQWTVPNGIL